MTALKPAKIFSQTDQTLCLWLNGSSSAHRPIWDKLWNNAAMRFITDGGANYVIPRTDLKDPDVVSGDLDSISEQILQKCKEKNVKVLETPDQCKTDFHKALEIIVAEAAAIVSEAKHRNVQQIICLGGLSGRFDHTLGTLNTLLCGLTLTEMPIWILDGENLLTVLPEGSTSVYVEKVMLTGKCGVVPFCQEKTIVSMKGFRWNLKDEEMKFGGIISTSNEVESDLLEIDTTAPVLLTFELKEDFLQK